MNLCSWDVVLYQNESMRSEVFTKHLEFDLVNDPVKIFDKVLYRIEKVLIFVPIKEIPLT